MFNQILNEALEANSEEALAAAALKLAVLGDELKAAMDSAKAELRVIALRKLDNKPGSVNLSGGEVGVVSINLPKPSLKVLRDRENLQRDLGERYAEFFEERITVLPRGEFRALAANAPNELREVLFKAVSEEDSTPRVSFRYVR